MGSIRPLIFDEEMSPLEILSEKTVVQTNSPYEPLDEKTCVVLKEDNKADSHSQTSMPELNKQVSSENTLISSAMPLIHYAMGLLTINDSVDISVIRTRLISDIGRFENKAEQCFSDRSQVAAARYLLCSFIDEIVSTSPWGQSHRWSQESLLSYFHSETYGGDGFFKLLERAQQKPANYLDLLELMYVCLSLGFAGRYRIDRDGVTKLEGLRESMMNTITQCRAPDNRSLVVGETISSAFKNKRVKVKCLQRVVFTAAIILMLAGSVSYMLASYEIDNQMDRVNKTLGANQMELSA